MGKKPVTAEKGPLPDNASSQLSYFERLARAGKAIAAFPPPPLNAPNSQEQHRADVVARLEEELRADLFKRAKEYDLSESEFRALALLISSWIELPEARAFALSASDGRPAPAANDTARKSRHRPPELADIKEFWADRDLKAREPVPKFIERVYKRWLRRGLKRQHIAQLDPPLYKALSVFLVRNPDHPIAASLPARGESTRHMIEKLSKHYPLEELRRIGYAIDQMLRRSGESA